MTGNDYTSFVYANNSATANFTALRSSYAYGSR